MQHALFSPVDSSSKGHSPLHSTGNACNMQMLLSAYRTTPLFHHAVVSVHTFIGGAPEHVAPGGFAPPSDLHPLDLYLIGSPNLHSQGCMRLFCPS